MVKELLSNIRNKELWIPFSISIGCFLIVFLFGAVFSENFELWNNQMNDNLFKLRYQLQGKGKASPYMVNVVLDDSSIRNLDIPLFDRAIIGKTISILNQFDVDSIACDMVFPDKIIPPQDDYLIKEIQSAGNVYLPVIFRKTTPDFLNNDNGNETSEKILTDSLWHPIIKSKGHPFTSSSHIISFPELNRAARGIGHITCDPDPDGMNRYFPLIFQYKDGIIPSLTFRAVCDYLKVKPQNIELNFGSSIILKDAEIGGGLKKDIKIPIDHKGRLMINYIGPWSDSFVIFPLHKVLETAADEALFFRFYNVMNGSLVVFSDISTRNKDYQTGVFDHVYPLSTIHLTVANSILTDNFIESIPPVFAFLYIATMIIVLYFFSIKFKNILFFIAAFILYLIFISLNILLFLLFSLVSLIFIQVSAGFFLTIIGQSIFKLFTATKKALESINLEIEIDSLKQIDKIKTEYVENIIHEYKTPLTVIKGYLTEIENLKYGKEIKSNAKVLKSMNTCCTRMLGNIENLLLLSEIEIGKSQLKRQKTNVTQFIFHYCSHLESIGKQKGITVEFKKTGYTDIEDYIDEDMLAIAFSNLLINAVKFTDSPGKILVKIDNDKNNNSYHITVSDTGTGIPEEMLDSLFVRYKRVNRNSTNSGAGIGLALVKKIIDLHGGTIEVYNNQDKGTTFKITLLYYNEEPMATGKTGKSHTKIPDLLRFTITDKREKNNLIDADKKNILIIEDNPDMLDYYESVLSSDYNFSMARNGSDGLGILNTSLSYDLILLDLVMPILDGKEFLMKLSQTEAYSHIPVLFVTGRASKKDKLLFSRYGLDWVQKPFTAEEFMLTIQKILNREVKTTKRIAELASRFSDEGIGKIPASEDKQNIKKMLLLKKYGITRAELRILELVAVGSQDKEIGSELGLSTRTIEHHIYRMNKKAGSTNRTELLKKLGYVVR